MKPLRNFLLIGEAIKENKSDGGIVLTSDKASGMRPGKVLAVGEDVSGIVVSDVVYCDWQKSFAVTHENKPCVLLADEHVMAIDNKE